MASNCRTIVWWSDVLWRPIFVCIAAHSARTQHQQASARCTHKPHARLVRPPSRLQAHLQQVARVQEALESGLRVAVDCSLCPPNASWRELRGQGFSSAGLLAVKHQTARVACAG